MRRLASTFLWGLLLAALSLPAKSFLLSGAPDDGGWQYPTTDYQPTGRHLGTKVEGLGYHLGEDVRAPVDTPVYAAASGYLKMAQPIPGYGDVVIIEHRDLQVCSLYGHLWKLQVARDPRNPNQYVKRGALLGYTADKAHNGGWDPHLHFGVRSGLYSTARELDGKWRYEGYSFSRDVVAEWEDPTQWVKDHRLTGATTPPPSTPPASTAPAAVPGDVVPTTTVQLRRDQPGHWKVLASYPQFEGDTPVARLANQIIAALRHRSVDTFIRYAREHPKSMFSNVPYEHQSAATVTLSQRQLISLYVLQDEYLGGAHGNQTYEPLCFGLVRGQARLLRLEDLFRPGQQARWLCADRVLAKLRDNPKAEWVRDGSLTSQKLAEEELKFVITPTSLLFLFDPYQLGSYAAGMFPVEIPFAEFGDTLDSSGPLKPLLATRQASHYRVAQSTPSPPSVPFWPCTATATLRLAKRDSYSHAVLAAQLDGRADDELVTVTDAFDAAGKPVKDSWQKSLTVYAWRNGSFRQLARRSFSLEICDPVTGDLDRDGCDKIYAVSKSNALLTIRLVDGNLKIVDAAHLGDWMVGSIAVADIRRQGVPELLLAVDPTKKFGSYGSQGEPNCQMLLGYRRLNGKWVRTWQQGIKQRSSTLTLHPGDYHPLAGTELVFEHDPDDFTRSLFELWHWNGTQLVRIAETETVAASRTGLQNWIGVSDRLTYRARTIVANVSYDTQSNPTPSRVELLQWDGGTLRALYQLPGHAVTIADVRGSGRAGILVWTSGSSLTLYEPLPGDHRSREPGRHRR